MEITSAAAEGPAEGLGPRPGHAGARRAPLSGPRAAVLDVVQAAGRPVTVADVAAGLDLHLNTAREHLDALADAGLLVRGRARATGRGRPAWTYAPDPRGTDPQVREYAGLASALAGHLARTSTNPRADALAAGEDWGVELVGGVGAGQAAGPVDDAAARPDGTAVAARRRVVALLRDLGFDPDTDDAATSVALRSCPLLEAARRYPDVVCAVHLGIARGALRVLGSDPDPAELRPFAEPGACRLLLAATS